MVELSLRAAVEDTLDSPVESVHIGRSTSVGVLADGAVGCAMDYDHYRYAGQAVREQPRELGADTLATLLRRAPGAQVTVGDVLGTAPWKATACAEQTALSELTWASVRVAVLNAASRHLFTPVALSAHGLTRLDLAFDDVQAPRDDSVPGQRFRQVLATVLPEGCTVGVVGLGGLLETLVQHPHVRCVALADAHLDGRAEHVTRLLAGLRALAPDTEVNVVGTGLHALAEASDLVQVTPSSLTNGTMDEVLEATAGRPKLVVGPTGASAPAAWFAAGAVLLVTEVKDRRLPRAYHHDEYLYHWFNEYDHRIVVHHGPSEREGAR
ncbi:DUF364 domain-containing protein [Streptomyces tubbatahanensis]|uniref:DUF364 domain-containing protein n=1 Tax=Streptomyces tubbatahanensis TaxID=2923272 RepID=A0ABY3XKW2_9ACTN|nr:DUF364 domain-containing protein [Streptomyces tubbatahanensis]UNS95039.1 DUF364 domain-containing protein [Streptomyces tubbatahanensis]